MMQSSAINTMPKIKYTSQVHKVSCFPDFFISLILRNDTALFNLPLNSRGFYNRDVATYREISLY